MAAAIWTVPAERMKAGKQHLVPPSAPALVILKRMAEVALDELVFPSITGSAIDTESLGKGRPSALTRMPVNNQCLTRP
ncbi:hypothetical protein [Sphingomonas sp. 22R3R2A-7]|uniref:hypothetical protein n=1 Tax=Sphingomonas sp. 22R3R2A-7 TaxID=3050230 RepID=UPI002FE0100B